jgi:hypothetical protein
LRSQDANDSSWLANLSDASKEKKSPRKKWPPLNMKKGGPIGTLRNC